MKELEEWMPDDSGQDELELDVSNSGANGWSAHDMFAKNEEFGVKTSFDPNMSSYTVQLKKDREDSAEWREKERKAAKIAAEIEGNSSSVAAVELENGDEEEAFSAVVRGEKDEKAYVPPGRRGEQGRGGGRDGGRAAGGRGGARTTPPGDVREDYRGNRYERNFPGNRGGYNNDRDRDRYDRGYSNDYRADNRFNRQDSHRDSNKQMDRGGYKKDDKKVSPVPEQEKAGGRPGPGEQQRSPATEVDGGAKLAGKKSREQQQNELKEFKDNFHLTAAGPGGSAKSPTATATTPRVSVKTGGSQGGTPLPSPQPGQETPVTPTASSPPAASTPGTDQGSAKKSTLNPNAKEFSLNPTAKEFTPRAAPTGRVNPTPPRPQTPNTPNSLGAGALAAQGLPQAFSQSYITLAGPGQMGMTHVNNGMFVPGGQPHMMGPGVQYINRPVGQQGRVDQTGDEGLYFNISLSAGNPRGGPAGKDSGGGGGGNSGAGGRPDLPSPLQVTGHPILAGGVANPHHSHQQFLSAGYPTPQHGLYPGPGGHQAPPMVRMIMPSGAVPGQMLAPAMMPVLSQADSQAGAGSTQNMWTGGPSGPGQPSHPPPTPPQHGTQPSTPAPSPGIQQMYGGPHHQPPQYPGQGQILTVIPGGHAAFPGHGVPTSAVGPHGAHMAHMMGGGGGQPVTSMSGMMQPQFQYLPHNQGKLQ